MPTTADFEALVDSDLDLDVQLSDVAADSEGLGFASRSYTSPNLTYSTQSRCPTCCA